MSNQNQNPSMLTVASISEIRTDKNGHEYVNVTVKGDEKQYINTPAGVITAFVPSRQTAINAYQENYLGQQDFLWDKKVGTVVLGQIVTRNVQPYELTINKVTRTVNTYTCVVFGNTNDTDAFEVAVQRAFSQAGHPLNIDATTPVVTESMKG